MRKPIRPAVNRSREQRIIDEIIVDAYGSEERAMSWYYHLEEKLNFPFKAKCLTTRAVSPLEKGDAVEVLKMAPEDDCMKEMCVIIRFGDRTLGVPLSQLEALKGDEATNEAISDSHYWSHMGYRF